MHPSVSGASVRAAGVAWLPFLSHQTCQRRSPPHHLHQATGYSRTLPSPQWPLAREVFGIFGFQGSVLHSVGVDIPRTGRGRRAVAQLPRRRQLDRRRRPRTTPSEPLLGNL